MRKWKDARSSPLQLRVPGLSSSVVFEGAIALGRQAALTSVGTFFWTAAYFYKPGPVNLRRLEQHILGNLHSEAAEKRVKAKGECTAIRLRNVKLYSVNDHFIFLKKKHMRTSGTEPKMKSEANLKRRIILPPSILSRLAALAFHFRSSRKNPPRTWMLQTSTHLPNSFFSH